MARRIAFFAESSPSVGIGHAMRSGVLAEQFSVHGWQVDFYSDLGHAQWVINFLQTSTINHIDSNLGSSIRLPYYDLIVLDTYSEENLQKTILQFPRSKIITIEDSSTPEVKSDFRVFQSLFTEIIPSRKGQNKAGMVSGPRHLLVRNQIENIEVSDTLKSGNVIVLSGGSDQTNFAKSVYSAIITFESNYSFHFIGLPPTSAERVTQNVTFYPYGTKIEDLNIPLSFSISLAGVSAIELLAAKVPTILAASVENQFPNYNLLTTKGYAVALERYDKELGWTFSAEDLLNALEKLVGVRHLTDLDFEGAKIIYREINKFFY